ncbi:hypothetical protein EV652_11436 [Kribbella steppae]|uniref:Uncharacterized protein n=1 Tax=Kribbella steppae TaxID=2512223 RepID=A0A4R2H249_9ACTN|nr:alpha-L-rhamnosidase C-terminal domain-containing protein [Kribbella steppae]TCO19060.1 hypothetical protein EV652_11436 [Kribbella steppae]
MSLRTRLGCLLSAVLLLTPVLPADAAPARPQVHDLKTNTLDVTVPANTTATVRIPARDGSIDVQEIASGTCHFEAR